MNNPLLIQYLKQFRIQANFTQLYMATQLGKFDEDHYGKLERNQKELKLYCLKRLAHALDLSPFLLLHLSGYQCFSHTQFIDLQNTKLTHQAEIDKLIQDLCIPDYDLHAVHFYIRLYKGIKQLRKINKISCKDLSMALSYSPNHFARMERELQELSVSEVFQICRAVNTSFVKLMLFASCFTVFTNKHGKLITLTDVSQKYVIR
jgi:transcriptional regulator with XRE-family HTH domain